MRIKFLVLFAVICLSIHAASAHKKAAKPEPVKSEEEEVVEIRKHKHKEAPKEVKHKQVHKEVIKKHHKKTVKIIPCAELVEDDKKRCEATAPKGYKGIFTYQDNDDCDWKCDYEAIPGHKKSSHHRRHKHKIVKVKKEKKEKPIKKECSGQKVFKMRNCLIKLKGLVAWGDKTKDFDNKFVQLFKKKSKKAKGGKPGPKKH